METWDAERDLYRLLGVTRDASSREIRKAYVDRLKRSHPDLGQGRYAKAESDYVAALILAYSALRDPQRRAAYDLELAHGDQAQLARRTGDRWRARPATPRVARYGRMTWRSLAKFATAFGATLSAIAVIYAFLGMLGASHLANPPPPTAGLRAPQLLSDRNIAEGAERMARYALHMSIDEASEFSRQCFQRGATDKDYHATLNCVMFDDAVLLSKHTEGAELPTYFQLRWLRARHADAILPWSTKSDEALDALWVASARSLVRQIRASMSSDTPSDPTSKTVAQVASGLWQPAPSHNELVVDGRP